MKRARGKKGRGGRIIRSHPHARINGQQAQLVPRAAAPSTTIITMPMGGGRVKHTRHGAVGGRHHGNGDGGGWGLVKYVGGLGGGGALGTAVQATLQAWGLGPIVSKGLSIVGAWLLRDGARPGSLSSRVSDGMVASTGGGLVMDLIQWWKNRKSASNLIGMVKDMSAAEKAELLKALQNAGGGTQGAPQQQQRQGM